MHNSVLACVYNMVSIGSVESSFELVDPSELSYHYGDHIVTQIEGKTQYTHVTHACLVHIHVCVHAHVVLHM